MIIIIIIIVAVIIIIIIRSHFGSRYSFCRVPCWRGLGGRPFWFGMSRFHADSACFLLQDLRCRMLQALAEEAGRHFEGLSAAARWYRQQGRLSNAMCRKLCRLDDACSFLRHATRPLVDAVALKVEEELRGHAPMQQEPFVEVSKKDLQAEHC